MAYDPLALERAIAAEQQAFNQRLQFLVNFTLRNREQYRINVSTLRSVSPGEAARLAPKLGVNFEDVFTQQELQDYHIAEIEKRTGGLYTVDKQGNIEPVGDEYYRAVLSEDIYADDGVSIDPAKLDAAINKHTQLITKGSDRTLIRGDRLPPGVTPEDITAGSIGKAAVTPKQSKLLTKEPTKAATEKPKSQESTSIDSMKGDVPPDTPYAEAFNKYGSEFGVPPRLLAAMAKKESGFNPAAVGPPTRTGERARGMMQFMPTTAAEYGLTDPHDADQSIRAAAQYMSKLLKQFKGDAALAVAAYNAGPGNVRQHGGVPPFPETQAYVTDVLADATSQETPPTASGTEKPTEATPQQQGTTSPAFSAFPPAAREAAVVGYTARNPQVVAAASNLFIQETGLPADVTIASNLYNQYSTDRVRLAAMVHQLDVVRPGDPNSLTAFAESAANLRAQATAVLQSEDADPQMIAQAKHMLEVADAVDNFVSQGTPSTVVSAAPAIKSLLVNEMSRLDRRRSTLWNGISAIHGTDVANNSLGPPPVTTIRPGVDTTPTVRTVTTGPSILTPPPPPETAFLKDVVDFVSDIDEGVLQEIVNTVPNVNNTDEAKRLLIQAVVGRDNKPLGLLNYANAYSTNPQLDEIVARIMARRDQYMRLIQNAN